MIVYDFLCFYKIVDFQEKSKLKTFLFKHSQKETSISRYNVYFFGY